MVQTKENPNEKVTLVALDAFSPYRKGEVFTVNRREADALLTANYRENEFGPVYPSVKVREYDASQDEHLLLDNGVLNQKDSVKLEDKLYGNSDSTEAASKYDESGEDTPASKQNKKS